jgi:hypothetical protein
MRIRGFIRVENHLKLDLRGGLTFVFLNQGNFPAREQGSGLVYHDIGQITREVLQVNSRRDLRQPASFGHV